MPSVLSGIKDNPSISNPMSVYRQQVVNKVCPSEYEAVCKARNVKQVENVQVQKRSAKRISIDPHRNLILLAHQIDSIYQMIYYPDIAIFCGNDFVKMILKVIEYNGFQSYRLLW